MSRRPRLVPAFFCRRRRAFALHGLRKRSGAASSSSRRRCYRSFFLARRHAGCYCWSRRGAVGDYALGSRACHSLTACPTAALASTAAAATCADAVRCTSPYRIDPMRGERQFSRIVARLTWAAGPPLYHGLSISPVRAQGTPWPRISRLHSVFLSPVRVGASTSMLC